MMDLSIWPTVIGSLDCMTAPLMFLIENHFTKFLSGAKMKKVTVNKTDLLTKLEENCINHVKEFEVANKEYQETITLALRDRKEKINKILDGWIDKVQKEPVKVDIDENLWFDITPPVSHEKDYNRVIGMVKMEVSDKIDLDIQDYGKYIEDDWSWKEENKSKRIMYAAANTAFAP